MSAMAGNEILDLVRPSIFRLETKFGDTIRWGTAFAVGRQVTKNGLVLATAAHVLRFPPDTERVAWTLQQFDQDGYVERELRTETPGAREGSIQFSRNDKFDSGVCILPNRTTDGEPFTRDNERPLRMIAKESMAPEGTRVGWAGFAGIVEEYLKHPQLCYFEGVISAAVNRPERPVYIVDGHSAHGVSGGPLWRWTDENQVEVIGIMSAYRGSKMMGLPGFCVFEPIQPVSYYLERVSEEARAEIAAQEA